MTDTILIGYDGSDASSDALALARVLSPDGQARLIATCVVALPHLSRDGAELRRRLEPKAADTLSAIRGQGLETRPVVSASAGQGLFELAESEQAGLLVVGSSQRAGLGAVLAGSVGRALLQGAPCPVAVAPRGYAGAGADRLRVIGVGYDASPESEAALDGAIELALGAEATLRVMMVLPPAIGPDRAVSGRVSREPTHRSRMQDALRVAVERCPPEVRALPQALTGTPTAQLLDAAEGGVDLLVVGSRGYGPFMRVMLGSVADMVMRSAPCPVLVFPRAGAPGERS